MKQMQMRWREELADLADGLALLWALARECRQSGDGDYSFFESPDRG